MTKRQPSDILPRVDREDVRAYVLDMLAQLAELADRVGEYELASRIDELVVGEGAA